MKTSLVLGLLLVSVSSFASDRVRTVVAECVLEQGGSSAWEMSLLMEEGFKLVEVIQLDNPPQQHPGFQQRKCSYVFAQQ